MKYTIILLLTLVIATKENGVLFTINPFINYLQETGYYEVINDVKCQITSDVAIEVCEILTESPHCEEVVRIYMTCAPRTRPISRRSPTSPPSRADIFISILDSHNMPHDKFERLIFKLKLRRRRDDLEIKPHNLEEKRIETNKNNDLQNSRQLKRY